MLNENPTLAEILWNLDLFEDERHLTLKQNPHFYTHLPMLPEAYDGGGFKMAPTEDFLHADKFYVLTDRQGLAYFKTDKYMRCFGNFWCPNGAISFKDKHSLYLFSLFFLVSDIMPGLGGSLWARILLNYLKANAGSFVRGHKRLETGVGVQRITDTNNMVVLQK